MPTEHRTTFVAGGNIRRNRVVFLSDDFTILEASVNVSLPPAGIAQDNCRNPPGTPFDTSLFAGSSGDEVMVYTHGAEALAECGNTVTAGKMVTYGSDARILDAGGAPPWSMWTIGQALEDGAAGDVVRIRVILR